MAEHTPWVACEEGAYEDFDGTGIVVLGDDRRIAVFHHKEFADIAVHCVNVHDDLVRALEEARAALHFRYVEWDGEPEDAVPLQLARAKCDAALARAKGGEG